MRSEVQQQSLKGIRVLELTSGPSGAYAGRLFAESGAFVQKVLWETKSITRYRDEKKKIYTDDAMDILHDEWDLIIWDSHCSLDQSLSNYFHNENPINVGVRICFPPGISLDEEEDFQALGGWMELTGDPDREPLKVGGHPASSMVGAHAATGGLLALLEKKSTGKGRLIEISSSTIITSALEGVYSNYLDSGIVRTRKGNRHNKLTPMAILPALDGWAFVGSPVDEQWSLLERWAGFLHNPVWVNAEERSNQQGKVEATLEDWTKNMEKEELFLTGQGFRMPFASVQSLQEIRDCPQLKAREFWSSNNMKLPWKMNASINDSLNTDTVKPLNELRILDLTSMWSGPYCTRLFADLGAEVIKIEAPHRPDGIRPSQGNSNPFFCELNRNKLGIDLNLQLMENRDLFLRLVETADVLVENFSPRVMGNLGLSEEKLRKIKPELLIVSLSAFGQSGPYRDFIGYGPTIESMSGIAWLTRYEDSGPWLPGFSVSDLGAGIHGAFALVAALFYRWGKGIGIRVDVSQYEVACQFSADYIFGERRKGKATPRRKSKELKSIFEKGEMNILALDDGTNVLGAPWESLGWAPNSSPPPELGQHRELILQSIKGSSNNIEKEALLNEI